MRIGVKALKVYDGRACPWCGNLIEAQIQIGYEQMEPRGGDFSMCSECGKLAVFEDDGVSFRKATDVEIAALFVDQPDALDMLMVADALRDELE